MLYDVNWCELHIYYCIAFAALTPKAPALFLQLQIWAHSLQKHRQQWQMARRSWTQQSRRRRADSGAYSLGRSAHVHWGIEESQWNMMEYDGITSSHTHTHGYIYKLYKYLIMLTVNLSSDWTGSGMTMAFASLSTLWPCVCTPWGNGCIPFSADWERDSNFQRCLHHRNPE